MAQPKVISGFSCSLQNLQTTDKNFGKVHMTSYFLKIDNHVKTKGYKQDSQTFHMEQIIQVYVTKATYMVIYF
jgi:hypothetical protein